MLGFLAFLILAASWIGVLWFGVPLNFAQWSDLELLAIHALPPVVAGLTWRAGRAVIRRNKAKRIEEQEKQAEAQRQAAQEEARNKHEQEMQQRRFACDCRVIASGELACHEEIAVPTDDSVWIQTVPVEKKAAELDEVVDVMTALEPAITDTLRFVYERCGAAAALPLYIVPPTEAPGVEVLQRLQAIRSRLIKELALPLKPKAEVPTILHLPSSDSASNSVISLFENMPDLPGAVVLAFDSLLPRSDVAALVDETDREKETRKPGHGVFGLLVTHPALPAMLEAVADHPDEELPDSLTPYWAKAQKPKGNLALLTDAPRALRDALGELAVVARIHRAASGQTGERPGRVLELERTLTILLERAQIHAGMLDLPFIHQTAEQAPDEKPAPQTAPRCEWLVHNIGETARTGSRLAAIANALMHFQIELMPLDMGTDLPRQAGDLGRAASVAMLSIALAQAQAKGAPTLCVEFSDTDSVAAAFAVPAAE